MPTPRRTGRSPKKPAATLSSSPVASTSRTRRTRAVADDDEEDDPMGLAPSPLKKKQKTADAPAQDSPEGTRGSSRLRARASSINYAELNDKGKGRANEDEVELTDVRRSSRRLSSSASPTKKPTTPSTSSKPSHKTSISSSVKADPPAAPSSSSKPTRRAQRSPSPSSRSPVKPAGWRGWEIATEPKEQHPQKGYLSGLEILKKQGLLDEEGEKRLRNGRTVAKAVAKAKGGRDGSENRWGEDEEEEDADDDLEAERVGDEGLEVEGMDWEDETRAQHQVAHPPVAAASHIVQDPQLEAQARAPSPALPSALLAHLPATKALVLSHLTGRVPPLPPRLVADVKGKGKAKASPSDDVAEDVNAESVQTLIDLLKGTVERGEGNSCLIQGVKGGGKTTVLNQALDSLVASTSKPDSSVPPPIVIRLSALVQTDDRAAIREIGRQVGFKGVDGDEAGADGRDEGEAGEAKEVLQITTLPAHLLSILSAPSKKAIVIVLDEFDLFAGFGRGGRQMLLYCLLDVVQSIRPTLSATTLSSRGVAVVGLTSRIDTLHLLEKRVKSRFSHRIIRVSSPMHGDNSKNVPNLRPGDAVPLEADKVGEEPKWVGVVGRALVPWDGAGGDGGEKEWKGMWEESVKGVMEDEEVRKGMERLGWTTSDVRAVLRVFIRPVLELTPHQPLLTPARIIVSLAEQCEGPGWGRDLRQLAGLSPPELSVLASIKDLGERGITEFNFEHVFFTYGEFAKAKLVGSGKPRFSRSSMREAFSNLVSTSLIFPTSSSATAGLGLGLGGGADFAKHRCAVPAFDLVEFFRGEAGKRGVMTQLSAWGKKWDV